MKGHKRPSYEGLCNPSQRVIEGQTYPAPLTLIQIHEALLASIFPECIQIFEAAILPVMYVAST